MVSHAPTTILDLDRRLARVDDKDNSGNPASDRELRILEAGMSKMVVKQLTGLTRLAPDERHQFISDLSTAESLTVPVTASRAVAQAGGGAVRFRLDGAAPTGDTGMYLPTNATVDLTAEEAEFAQFIQATGATSVLNVTYI